MKWMMGLVMAATLAGVPASAAEFGKPGLAAVRIGVTDDARSIRFYQLLGMQVGRLYHPGQQEMTWADPAAGSRIVLVHHDAKSKLVPGGVSFMVYTGDVAATVAALRTAGFTAPDAVPGKNGYIELALPDPDGNLILLIGPNPN